MYSHTTCLTCKHHHLALGYISCYHDNHVLFVFSGWDMVSMVMGYAVPTVRFITMTSKSHEGLILRFWLSQTKVPPTMSLYTVLWKSKKVESPYVTVRSECDICRFYHSSRRSVRSLYQILFLLYLAITHKYSWSSEKRSKFVTTSSVVWKITSVITAGGGVRWAGLLNGPKTNSDSV